MKMENKEINKAAIVMSSLPPNENISNIVKTSRLSPVNFEQLKKKKKKSFLKNRNHEKSFDEMIEEWTGFHRPAKDYFLEASFENKERLDRFESGTRVVLKKVDVVRNAKRDSQSLSRVKKEYGIGKDQGNFRVLGSFATQTD
jgi:hypothetical protein